MGSGITASGSGITVPGIRNYSSGIWDHSPEIRDHSPGIWDYDQQILAGSGIRLCNVFEIRDHNCGPKMGPPTKKCTSLRLYELPISCLSAHFENHMMLNLFTSIAFVRVHNRLLRCRFPAHFFPLIPLSRPFSLGNPDPNHFAKTFLCNY